MSEETYLEFFKNTLLSSSKAYQRFICKKLEEQKRIDFNTQLKLNHDSNIMIFESKKAISEIISKTSTESNFINFYENTEFTKLYKYSVPFYYEANNINIKSSLKENGINIIDNENYTVNYILGQTLEEAIPTALINDEQIFLKFVLQKSYVHPASFDRRDYRYPIVIYIDYKNNFLEIRYDSIRYNELFTIDDYCQMVDFCISWIKEKLNFNIYLCDHSDIIEIINNKQNENVKMYKQMMELNTGGAAELTASETTDYVIPFIGEIKELIDENEELFIQSEDIKNLLMKYLSEKEATALYQYIYLKWVKPVESQSYIVKVTFDYFKGKYTLLQHITGSCRDLEMERMNDAIKYLCQSGSFVKGEKI